MSGEMIMGYIILLLALGFIVMMRKLKEKKELERISNMDIEQKKLELMKMQTKMAEHKTSHVLHLLLSVITGGLWIIVWILVSHSNSSKRKNVENLINKM